MLKFLFHCMQLWKPERKDGSFPWTELWKVNISMSIGKEYQILNHYWAGRESAIFPLQDLPVQAQQQSKTLT